MQAFGNIATEPVRKVSKTTQKGYYEFRLCENQRGAEKSPLFYSVRVMKDVNQGFAKGDFIKTTGTLKADSYLNREGKPTTTLVIIAFEAVRLKSVTELKAAKQEVVPA